MIRPQRKNRVDDDLPLSLRELAQSMAIVAVLVLSIGAWLVGAGANRWVGIVLVAAGAGAIGWWYVRRRVPDPAERDGGE